MRNKLRERIDAWLAARLEEYCRLTGLAPADLSSRNFRRWLIRHRPLPPDVVEALGRLAFQERFADAIAKHPEYAWVRVRRPNGDEAEYLVHSEKAPPAVRAEAERQAAADWDGTIPPLEEFERQRKGG